MKSQIWFTDLQTENRDLPIYVQKIIQIQIVDDGQSIMQAQRRKLISLKDI